MFLSPRRARKLIDQVDRLSARAHSLLERRAYPGRGTHFPPIIIFAQPKSASVFIHRAIRRTLQVPFYRVGVGGIHHSSIGYSQLAHFSKGNVVSREHLPGSPFMLQALAAAGIGKAVLHVRNPSDSVVSWTRMVDRTLETRGMAGAALLCERVLPADYPQWSFPDKLRWQIANYLPLQVAWIENWLQLADSQQDVNLLVTTYEEFAADPRAYVARVLEHFDIHLPASEISLPSAEIGRSNIFSADGNKWAGLDSELHDMARDRVPESLRAGFGWG
ncbi:hypothetical protein A8950_0822 [Dongia mobilis]|uniref:Sulfotransferase domain-containing protein n=1 Tax=Dongia mobilis TaxID=578943 RepID=A0A4R6WW56_9PROT|nr:sulfotransferase domain-containing protein [Dongia mobilis]TDQ84274.1 hypothetical protein A8950_0822 [Dongia mobilis]